MPFHHSHKQTNFTVKTKIPSKYIDEQNIKNINFLKIDTEGHDFVIIQNFPWNKIMPDVVIYEYENNKTLKQNYTFEDMGKYLSKLGYIVLVSEWHPIIKYGVVHKWKQFVIFGKHENKIDENSWGNFICFKTIDEYKKFIKYLINNNHTKKKI